MARLLLSACACVALLSGVCSGIPCAYDDNGKVYDFSGLTKSGGYTGSDGTYSYNFNVCGLPTSSDPHDCEDDNAWFCQFDGTKMEAKIGLWEAGAVTWSTSPDGNPLLSTSNGDKCFPGEAPRVGTIEFKCLAGTKVGAVSIENTGCTYSITMETECACAGGCGSSGKKGGGGGLSGGWVFMILLFVFVPLYVVGGCFYNHKQKGAATWRERCPHPTFWLAIVALTKEGCYFTRDKIKELMGGGGGGGKSGGGEEGSYDNF